MVLNYPVQNVNRVLDKLYAMAPDPLADFEREEAFHKGLCEELAKAEHRELVAREREEAYPKWVYDECNKAERGDKSAKARREGNVIYILLPGLGIKAKTDQQQRGNGRTDLLIQPSATALDAALSYAEELG
jgi:hypothetical protein